MEKILQDAIPKKSAEGFACCFADWLCVAEKLITIAAAGSERVQGMKPERFPKPIAWLEIEKAADSSLHMVLWFLRRARYASDGLHQGFWACWSAFFGEFWSLCTIWGVAGRKLPIGLEFSPKQPLMEVL